MAAIPGWVYVLIGVLMSVFSKLVEAKTKPGTFKLFFWIGILFILMGIGKYIFKKKNKETPASLRQPFNQQSNYQHQAHYQARQQPHQANHPQHSQAQQNPANLNFSQGQHHVNRVAQQQPINQADQHPSIVACSACGTRHYDYARYCMQCGTKLRRR